MEISLVNITTKKNIFFSGGTKFIDLSQTLLIFIIIVRNLVNNPISAKPKATVVLAPIFLLVAACGGSTSTPPESLPLGNGLQDTTAASTVSTEVIRPADYAPDAESALIGDTAHSISGDRPDIPEVIAGSAASDATIVSTIAASTSSVDSGTSPVPAVADASLGSDKLLANVVAATGARDPLKQPFSTGSIWNMPIGSGAVYLPANLPTNPGKNIWAKMPGIDDEHIVLKPTSPLTKINVSNAAWTGRNRCAATGGQLLQVPMPSNYIVPNSTSNSSSSFLLADGRSIVQTQPLARCTAGGPGTALVKFATVDLYGPGITGAHGGSGLSAIGGSIRVGELRPGSTGPRHVLKVAVYAKESLYRCSTRSNCFRWPAVTSDSYAVGNYGVNNPNSHPSMKMGSLLAIPPSTNLNALGLETIPARQLAWTLQNYGAYIVDDTYAPGFFLNAEVGPDGSVPAQFKADYGFEMEQKVQGNTPWMRDIQRLAKALHVVTNNSPTSIGGGGTPRQPLAPQI